MFFISNNFQKIFFSQVQVESIVLFRHELGSNVSKNILRCKNKMLIAFPYPWITRTSQFSRTHFPRKQEKNQLPVTLTRYYFDPLSLGLHFKAPFTFDSSTYFIIIMIVNDSLPHPLLPLLGVLVKLVQSSCEWNCFLQIY